MVCGRCEAQITPIRIFERDAKTGKGWLITRCPKERCAFNIDIEAHEPIKSSKNDDDQRRYFWKDYIG